MSRSDRENDQVGTSPDPCLFFDISFAPSSTCWAPRRRCIPAACGARPWTSWIRWWSTACCLSSVWETGSSSPTWEYAASRSSAASLAPPSCRSTTLFPPLTGEYGLVGMWKTSELWQEYNEISGDWLGAFYYTQVWNAAGRCGPGQCHEELLHGPV